VPDHLRMTFRVVDEKGRRLGEDKDLERLKLALKSRTQQAIARAAGGLEKSGLTAWTIGAELPHTFEQNGVRGYPALVDEGSSVSVRILPTPAEQAREMWRGTRRLLLLCTPSPVNSIQSRLGNNAKLALAHSPHGSAEALFDDCLACAADKLIAEAGGPAWDEEGFAKLRDAVRSDLYEATADTVVRTANILVVAHRVQERLRSVGRSLVLLPALTDLNQQYGELVHPGFVTETGWRRLPDLLRYLKAMERRLVKLQEDPVRDRDRLAAVQRVREQYDAAVASLPPDRREDERVRAVRWMLEELRVSLFAQQLGTPHAVSEQRIAKAIEALH
jgi:ATP-dependent helicase HrpA